MGIDALAPPNRRSICWAIAVDELRVVLVVEAAWTPEAPVSVHLAVRSTPGPQGATDALVAAGWVPGRGFSEAVVPGVPHVPRNYFEGQWHGTVDYYHGGRHHIHTLPASRIRLMEAADDWNDEGPPPEDG